MPEEKIIEDEIIRERLYCEALVKRMIEYEKDPRNFFKLNKRGLSRKILTRVGDER